MTVAAGKDSTFSGGTQIVNATTFELGAGATLGTGAIALDAAGAVLRIDGTTLTNNAINLADGVGLIELPAVAAAGDQAVAVDGSGHLTFNTTGGTATLDIAGVTQGTIFDIAPVTGGSTDVFFANQTATAATGGQFVAAVLAADALPATTDHDSFTIDLARGAGDLTLTQNLPVDSSATVTIADAAGSGQASELVIGAGKSLTLAGHNTFSGGVEIGAGATLTPDGATAAGTGAITFGGADGTLDISAGVANVIANFAPGDTIDVIGITTSATTVTSDIYGNVTIAGANGSVTLDLAGAGWNTAFSVAADGHGGVDVRTASPAAITVANAAQLEQAIAYVNALPAGGNQAVTIAFAQGATIDLSSDLSALTLAQGVTLTINGNGGTLNGANTYQGLVVDGGNVEIENLTISGMLAQGGLGGDGVNGGAAGGGGAGLGGGLFVGAGANVALLGDTFTDDSAQGGAGGTVLPGSPTAPSGSDVGYGNDSGLYSATSGAGGAGGGLNGGSGGGAGGSLNYSPIEGEYDAVGSGGFGGGGGGSVLFTYSGLLTSSPSGAGGFGGGGGGTSEPRSPGSDDAARGAYSDFGGGEGLDGDGGGGLGAGGAIFVEQGGSLTVASGVSESGDTAVGGDASGAEAGYGLVPASSRKATRP